MDLNADVGEGAAGDELLFAAGISSANVACGAHAGDGASMARACALAARHGVALGAHPGFADREHFGRREIGMEAEELHALVAGQLDALRWHAAAAGLGLRHVKPHGALYHLLNRDRGLADVFVATTRSRAPGASLFGPPEGELGLAAGRGGLRFVPEGFVDRAYLPGGALVPRGEPGAVLHDEGAAAAQALILARAGRVRTLCVHGDGPAALRMLQAAGAALVAAGFRISAPTHSA